MLDTCTLIWLCSSPDRLSPTAREIIDAAETRLLLSEASVLEIALKWTAGKLALPDPPRRWIESQIAAWSLDCRALGREDMYRAGELPHHHRIRSIDCWSRQRSGQTRSSSRPTTPCSGIR